MSQNNINRNEDAQQQASQWAQIVGQIVEKLLSGTVISTIQLTTLKLMFPKAKGTEQAELGDTMGNQWTNSMDNRGT